MKSAQISKYGGSEVVGITQNATIPNMPAAGKILVYIKAAGVNPVDWKIREGYFQQMMRLQFPFTSGMDFSGIVKEIGEGVLDFKQGDEVYGQAGVATGGSGAFAEKAMANAENISHKPKRLAKNLGAFVATTASANDKVFVQELGADQVIDYKSQNFEDLLHDYDSVFDTVGGETYKRSFRVLKKGGIIISMLDQPNSELMNQYNVKAIFQFTQADRERLTKLAQWVDQNNIRINVDRTFSLDEAGKALDYQKDVHPRGKVVLTM